jgi:hypothetical protein
VKVTMRALAAIAAFSLPLSLTAQESSRDRRAIEQAQVLSVQTLDPGLPNQPLLPWLTGVAGRGVKITWEVNDCGEQTGNPDADRGRDFPLCVDAIASWPDGRMAIVSVLMGTFQKGVTGTPALWAVNFKNGSRFDPIPKLRDLPARISAAN